MPINLDLIARAKAGEPEATQAVYAASAEDAAPCDNSPIVGVEIRQRDDGVQVLRLVGAAEPSDQALTT